MIGVRPLFSGRSLGEGEQATFDVVVVGPDGAALTRSGLRYELLRVETRYQWYRRDNTWDFEPVKLTRRIADGQFNVAAGTPARLSLPVQWGRYRLEISTGERDGPVTSIGFDAGWYTEATADTPDMLEVALDKPEYAPGDSMTVAVTARTAGKVTLNVIGERLLDDRHAGRAAGHRAAADSGRQGLGHRRLCGGDLAASARRQRPAHARPRHRRAVVQRQPPGAHARGRTWRRRSSRGPAARCAFRSRSAGLPPARRRASSSPPSMSASSISPTTSRRRRTTTISASAASPPSSAISTASSSTACRARAARSGAAATSPRRSCKAARRRRSRWRSIPAWSRSSPTAPPRSCSTSPTSPAPPA